jgi:hypothetical protein
MDWNAEFMRQDLVDGENSIAWFIQYDGLVMDVRTLAIPIQVEAFEKGLVPYIPAIGREGTAAWLSGNLSVLLREDLLDDAWATAVANPNQLPESQWFELIDLREKDHPADVIRPYGDLIEIGLERADDKYRYPKAIKAIKHLQDIYRCAEDEPGFAAYLADLRQRHRRKTSFVTKLDKALPHS